MDLGYDEDGRTDEDLRQLPGRSMMALDERDDDEWNVSERSSMSMPHRHWWGFSNRSLNDLRASDSDSSGASLQTTHSNHSFQSNHTKQLKRIYDSMACDSHAKDTMTISTGHPLIISSANSSMGAILSSCNNEQTYSTAHNDSVECNKRRRLWF